VVEAEDALHKPKTEKHGLQLHLRVCGASRRCVKDDWCRVMRESKSRGKDRLRELILDLLA